MRQKMRIPKWNTILFHLYDCYYKIKFLIFPHDICCMCGCTGEMEFFPLPNGDAQCIVCVETQSEEVYLCGHTRWPYGSEFCPKGCDS